MMEAKSDNPTCPMCGSGNIKKNGFNKSGTQQYFCNDCGACRVLEPLPSWSKTKRKARRRVGEKKYLYQKTNHYSADRTYAPRQDILECVKDNVKTIIHTTGCFDCKDKAIVADRISIMYREPIGIVNHIIERVIRANGIEIR